MEKDLHVTGVVKLVVLTGLTNISQGKEHLRSLLGFCLRQLQRSGECKMVAGLWEWDGEFNFGHALWVYREHPRLQGCSSVEHHVKAFLSHSLPEQSIWGIKQQSYSMYIVFSLSQICLESTYILTEVLQKEHMLIKVKIPQCLVANESRHWEKRRKTFGYPF